MLRKRRDPICLCLLDKFHSTIFVFWEWYMTFDVHSYIVIQHLHLEIQEKILSTCLILAAIFDVLSSQYYLWIFLNFLMIRSSVTKSLSVYFLVYMVHVPLVWMVMYNTSPIGFHGTSPSRRGANKSSHVHLEIHWQLVISTTATNDIWFLLCYIISKSCV